MKKKLSFLMAAVLAVEIVLGAGSGIGIGNNVAYAAVLTDIVENTLPTAASKNVDPMTAKLQLEFNRMMVKNTSGLPQVNSIVIQGTSLVNAAVLPEVKGNVVDSTPNSTFDITLPTNTQLAYNTKYEVNIPPGYFIDPSNNDTSEAINWSFTTSTQDSSVTATFSLDGQTVDLAGKTSLDFKVNFSAPVVKGTGKIKLIKKPGNVVRKELSQAVKFNTNNTEAIITIDNIDDMKLEAGTSYELLIDNGAFIESSNAKLVGSQLWSFSTKSPAVIIKSLQPVKGTTSVPINPTVQLTFDRIVTVNGGGDIIVSPGVTTDTRAIKIPVSSTSITTVSGVSVVTVPLSSQMLLYGTTYNVTVPAGAYKDNYLNPSPVVGGSDWSFTTVAAPVSPGSVSIYSMSPSNGSTYVSLTPELVVSFSNNVAFKNGTYNNKITLKKANGASVAISRPAISGSQVRFSPMTTLESDTNYYVEIGSDTLVDYSNPNKTFGGITGSSQWNFRTVSVDKIPPVLQSVSMQNNTTIRLVYNEVLNGTGYLNGSNFTVTVNNESRRVSNAYTSGESVYVILEVGVAVGQKIFISYNGNLGNPIQDTSLNKAATFSLKEVSNGMDTALPKPREGTIYGNSLSLTFNESLKSPSSNAYEQFTVTADGSSMGIRSISQSGSMLYLTLNSSVRDGDVVKLSYRSGSYPIQDYRGLNIAEFKDFYIRNPYDNKAPVFTGAEGSGNKITIKYNEALKSSNLPAKNQWSVLANNIPIYVTGIEVIEDRVVLTLVSSFTKDQKVTLSYVPGYSTSSITDLNGNPAGYINLEPVTVSASTTVPSVKSASITGSTLKLQFITNVTTTLSNDALSRLFAVSVDDVSRANQSISLNGDTVTLQLSSGVNVGNKVHVSFNGSASAITSSSGNSIPSFYKLEVENKQTQNNTTSTTMPNGLGLLNANEFGRAMFTLSSNAATTTNGLSRFNQSILSYTLDDSKLKAAYDYVRIANTNNRTVVFEVPATEKAAHVSIPLTTLQEIYTRDQGSQIAVKLENSIYSIPLRNINIAKITQSLSTVPSNIAITIQMEKVPSHSATATLSQLGQGGSSVIVETIDFYAAAVNTLSKQSVPLDSQNEYIMRTASAAPEATSTLVYYDPSVYQISFIPTKITSWNANSVLTASVKGNYMVTGITSTKYFGDLNNHWAKDVIDELVSKYVISGRNSAIFAPNKNITRGEFAVFIAKALGLNGDAQAAARFRDVTSTSVEGAYIGAATKAGIISGFPDGSFKAGSFITREQMAIMVVRAMNYTGYKSTLSLTPSQTLKAFKDRAKIQSPESVAKVVQEGILQGVTATSFQPKGNATRAQAAVMLKRLLVTVGYL
ncbi:MAG TPA: Ig-like domain-containing protein [Paenibacillus sp.]